MPIWKGGGGRDEGGERIFPVYQSYNPKSEYLFFLLCLHINIQGKILIGHLRSDAQALGQLLCPGVGLSTVTGRFSEFHGIWEG